MVSVKGVEEDESSSDARPDMLHLAVAFAGGSFLTAGLAWYTDADLVVPVGLYVVATALVFARGVEHYRTRRRD